MMIINKLYPVKEDSDISPKLGCSLEKFKSITNGMDLFLSGAHCLNKTPSSYNNLPFNFYEDMGINKMMSK